MSSMVKEILSVEDNQADEDLLRMFFSSTEFELKLHFVKDGEEAMDFLLKKGKHKKAPIPHLILMDLNLPRINGKEVLRELKSRPLLKHIPVIILSTSASVDDVRDCYSLGASCYLTKPAKVQD